MKGCNNCLFGDDCQYPTEYCSNKDGFYMWEPENNEVVMDFALSGEEQEVIRRKIKMWKENSQRYGSQA